MASTQAQTALNFKRLTVNWPTIELYFTVGCGGNPGYTVSRQEFRILENGAEVRDFTLWCPDPVVRCAISVALVFDASGSMNGPANEGARYAGRAFIDLMDGTLDEAAIISFGAQDTLLQQMTSLKPLLYQAIESLPAMGATALRDGIYTGVTELISNGVNYCRAVIVMTDGYDNTSLHSAEDVILLANRNRLRVFTIGLGEHINTAELESIAHLTGGRYYQTPNAGQLAAIYKDISRLLFRGFQECVITYDRDCPDGTLRDVELQLTGYCGGTDAKAKRYRAPLDSGSFADQYLRIQRVHTIPREVVSIPVMVESLPDRGMLWPFDLAFLNADPARPMMDVSVPPGSPLSGEPLTVNRTNDSVRVRFEGETPASAGDTLFLLRFGTVGTPRGTFPVDVHTNGGGRRCTLTHIQSGEYRIAPSQPLRILTDDGNPAADTVFICRSGNVMLAALDGYQSYHWSTGATTQRISIDTPGVYSLRVVTTEGDTLHADSVNVRLHPRKDARIVADGPTTFCSGDRVTLRVAGDTAGSRILWGSERLHADAIAVSASGTYWAIVEDANGCRHPTDTIAVVALEPPVHLNIGADRVWICPGDSIELRVEEEYPHYLWSTGDSTRGIVVHAKGAGGYYSVSVRDSQGCVSRQHSINVQRYIAPKLTLAPSDHIALCSGGEVEVSADGDFVSWRWSTGDTTRTVSVRATGTYTVEGITAGGCRATAQLVVEDGVAARPKINTWPSSVLCNGGALVLDAGAEYVSYRWSNGDTTRTTTVTQPGSVWVEVEDYGGCTGLSDTIMIRREIQEVPEITADRYPVICPGDSIELRAPPGYAEYIWSTGDRTVSIMVHDDGKYFVSVLTPGGCEATSTAVQVFVRHPVSPVITRQGNVLSTTDRVVSHQWFQDGNPISGATNSALVITQTGNYRVQVVDSCGAVLMSEPFVVTTTGITQAPAQPRLDVYPDPNDGAVKIETQGLRGPIRAELFDLLGRKIAETLFGSRDASTHRNTLAFHAAPRGLYLLRITHADGVFTRRIVKSPH